MKIVGTNHGGYANRRNITDLPISGFETVRASNAFRLPNFLYFKATGKMHRYWGNLHWDGGFSNYDLLHFFNGISLGKKPWISTYETFLPRWLAYGGKHKRWGLEQLAKPQCKQLIALSACAKQIQIASMAEFPALQAAIVPKIMVLHPAQAIVADALEAKPAISEGIRLVIVGADFFRKGGLEVLRAFSAIVEKGGNFHLDIVSSLQIGDYASQAGDNEKQEALKIISRHPQQITWHKSLANEAVMQLFRRAHIGLLPTWADTYGYAALEAMAAACPVISTDVRALPEINNNQHGWVIQVKKDAWGNAILTSALDRQAFSIYLESQLLGTFEAILQNPAQILEKGKLAQQFILQNHSPEEAAQKTKAIYEIALRN